MATEINLKELMVLESINLPKLKSASKLKKGENTHFHERNSLEKGNNEEKYAIMAF
jgi:hypothetical protein